MVDEMTNKSVAMTKTMRDELNYYSRLEYGNTPGNATRVIVREITAYIARMKAIHGEMKQETEG